MTQQHALNVLCEGFPGNYNKDGDGNESFNNFSGTYKKYTKYIDYVPWPTPCEVAVEISRMANCEHLAAESMGQSKFDWAERTLKQQRGIREDAEADRWMLRQWGCEFF